MRLHAIEVKIAGPSTADDADHAERKGDRRPVVNDGVRPSVLLILQLPPPRHGASFMGQRIQLSERINAAIDGDYIRISTDDEDHPSVLWKVFRMFRLWGKVARRLVCRKFDVVYITPAAYGFPFLKDFVIGMLAKWLNGSVVYQLRNKGVSRDRLVPGMFKRWFFRDATVVLLSPRLYYDVEKFVPRQRVRFLPNGIEGVRDPRRDYRDRDCVSILFLSNMIRTKGVFVLLAACQRLKQRHRRFVCRFAGPWYEIGEREFYENVEELGIADVVEYLGPQYGENKEQVLVDADIFAFPTYYPDECFPGVLLEAMSAGLPVVTTDEGASSEIIDDGVTGFIVRRKDPVSLADALDRLIGDVQLRERLGRQALQKFSREYTISTFEDRFLDLIREKAGVAS